MDVPKCFYRVSAKGLILDETRTKFLVVQEENGKWELPGGGLDWGETPQETIAREINEEMGLTVTWVKDTPAYFLPGHKNTYDRWIVNVLFETKVANLDFTPSDECVALKFVTASEAKALTSFQNVQLLAELFESANH